MTKHGGAAVSRPGAPLTPPIRRTIPRAHPSLPAGDGHFRRSPDWPAHLPRTGLLFDKSNRVARYPGGLDHGQVIAAASCHTPAPKNGIMNPWRAPLNVHSLRPTLRARRPVSAHKHAAHSSRSAAIQAASQKNSSWSADSSRTCWPSSCSPRSLAAARQCSLVFVRRRTPEAGLRRSRLRNG
jgi:hypothetical protein